MFRPFILSLLLFSNLSANPQAATEAAASGEEAFLRGEYAKAIEWFTKAIAADDTNPSFYGNRASAHSYLGNLPEALKDYDKGIEKLIASSGNPKDKRLAYLFYNRAYACENAGQIKEALVGYQKVISVDPTYPDAHGNTAWILATHPEAETRDPAKALEYALIETKLTRMENASVLDTLAAAYAANAKFDEARSHQNQAIAKAVTDEDRREFTERLRLYEKKQPYIEPKKG